MAALICTNSTFESIEKLRDTLKMYALEKNCSYIIRNNNNFRFDARCIHEFCGFRLTAYKQGNGFVKIRQLNLNHSEFCHVEKSATRVAISLGWKVFVKDRI
jgi:hypothetical protein